MPRKLKVGSLFAGIGGISTAFKLAGCDVTWANEYNKNACKTYRENFPGTKLFNIDVDEFVSGINDFLSSDYPQYSIKSINSDNSAKEVDIITA